MNYVERAKRFLKEQAQGAALVAVPLAMAVGAGVAPAAPVLPTTPPACIVITNGSGGVDHCNFNSQTAPSGGTTFLGGTVGSVLGYSGNLLLGSGAAARIEQSGLLNESFSGSIVANYSFRLDFSDSSVDPISPTPWAVTIGVLQTGGNSYTSLLSGTGTFSGSVTIGNVNLTSGLVTKVYFEVGSLAQINVALTMPSSGFLTFTPVAATSSIPEPGTVAMVGLALGGICYSRRR